MAAGNPPSITSPRARRKGTHRYAATYPDVEALLPVVGQSDVGVELDGDALAVVAALAAVAPAAASPAPAAPPAAAVEGAVAQRGGDHLDVGRSSHQGQGMGGGAPLPAWWVEEEVCARGTERGGGRRERRLLYAAVVLWVRVGQRESVAAAGCAAPL
jgi:hypothetical protein